MGPTAQNENAILERDRKKIFAISVYRDENGKVNLEMELSLSFSMVLLQVVVTLIGAFGAMLTYLGLFS